MSSSEQFLGKIFRNDDIYGGGQAYPSNESFAFLLDPLYQTLKPVKVSHEVRSDSFYNELVQELDH